MQPGKTFEDFFRATVPYIGPMFAPPWWRLSTTGPPLVTEFAEDLWRTSSIRDNIVFFGDRGLPRLELARALCGAWNIDQEALRSIGCGADNLTELIGGYCLIQGPLCFHIDLEELFGASEELRARVLMASERHLKQHTGTRLVLTGHASANPLEQPPEMRAFFFDLGHSRIEVLPLRTREHMVLPWFLRYLLEYEAGTSSRILFFALNITMQWFGIRAIRPKVVDYPVLPNELEVAGFANVVANDPTRRTVNATVPTWGEDPAPPFTKGDRAIRITVGQGSLYPHLNPAWILDRKTGKRVTEDSFSVSLRDATSRYVLDRRRMMGDYAHYLKLPTSRLPSPSTSLDLSSAPRFTGRTSDPQPGTPDEAGVVRIVVAEGCRTISMNGECFDFSPRQAEIVKVLLQHFISSKIPKIAQSYVRDRCNFDDRTRMADVFKGCAAWGIVISSERGHGYLWLGSKSDPWKASQIEIENPDYVTERSSDFTEP